MLYVLAAVFAILWLAGVAVGYTMNGFIHLALLASIIFALAHLIRGELRS